MTRANRLVWLGLAFLFLTACAKQSNRTFRSPPAIPEELVAIWSDPAELWSAALRHHAAGEEEIALRATERLVDGFPKSEHQSAAQTLRDELRFRLGVIDYKIGVLLPLSGRYQNFGKLVWEGVSCAAGLFDPCSQAASPAVQWVIRDTEGNPELAVTMARELIEQEKVSAIIGPLLSQELEAIAKELPDAEVPLLTLATQKKPESGTKNILQHSVLPEQESEAIVAQIEAGGAKNLLILYPENEYGRQYHALVQKALAGGKTKLLAEIGYAPDIPDFFGLLEQFFRKEAIRKALLQSEGLAIFIPDSFREVRQIAQALDRLQIENVRMFGTSRWHHPGLLTPTTTAMERAIFVTPFDPQVGREVVLKFSDSFFQATGEKPTWMSAFGYDGALLLLTAMEEAANPEPEAIAQQLKHLKTFASLNGPLAFDKTGISRWNYELFRIEAGQWVHFSQGDEGISNHSEAPTAPAANP